MRAVFAIIFFIFFNRVEASSLFADKESESPPTVVEKSMDISKPNEVIVVKNSENEIPLNLESKKALAGNENGVFKFVLFFSILGTLLTGIWIFIKRINHKNISRNQNEIKVLAQHYLGPKKSVAVIRVAGESLLIGVTDHNVNLIKSLSILDEELPEVTPKEFNKLLTEEDEFSIKGIKDIVSTKLKSMRSI